MKPLILGGGGKSIQVGLDLGLWDKIKDKAEIWSVNYFFMTMPYLPARELWCDRCFFTENQHKLEEIASKGVQCHTKCNSLYNNIPEIQQWSWTREQYFGRIDKPIFTGSMGLSGIFALSLAVAQRYAPIYLLGYDYGTSGMKDTQTHYYQGKLITTSHGVNNPSIYHTDTGVKNSVNDFEVYKEYSSNIFNISPTSNIKSFQKLDYQSFFSLLTNN